MIQNYKNSKKEANLSYQRKLKGQILVKHHFGYKETVTLLDLSKFANVIYYVFEVGKEAEGQKLVSNHASKLNNIYSIAKNETRPYKTNYGTTTKRYVRYWEKEYKFIGIAKSNVPLLKNLENIIPIEEIEEFDIYKKYDQLHTDLMYLKTLEYKVGKFPWGIRSDKVKTITTQIQDIENKFVSWGNYPSNETLLPSKELKEFGDSVIKELEKIEILKYLSFNMPSKFLIPITSKLKSRYLKPNYLGSNPAKEYKERQFKQNIFLL